MHRISRPTELPRAKVCLPALLVQVREYQEQQKGDNPR